MSRPSRIRAAKRGAVYGGVTSEDDPIVFVLWGAYAQKKLKLIDTEKHTIIQSAHPSPLSAYRGFLGSRPFSRVNTLLVEQGGTPVDWSLPA